MTRRILRWLLLLGVLFMLTGFSGCNDDEDETSADTSVTYTFHLYLDGGCQTVQVQTGPNDDDVSPVPFPKAMTIRLPQGVYRFQPGRTRARQFFDQWWRNASESEREALEALALGEDKTVAEVRDEFLQSLPAQDVVERYNPQTRRWERVPALPHQDALIQAFLTRKDLERTEEVSGITVGWSGTTMQTMQRKNEWYDPRCRPTPTVRPSPTDTATRTPTPLAVVWPTFTPTLTPTVDFSALAQGLQVYRLFLPPTRHEPCQRVQVIFELNEEDPEGPVRFWLWLNGRRYRVEIERETWEHLRDRYRVDSPSAFQEQLSLALQMKALMMVEDPLYGAQRPVASYFNPGATGSALMRVLARMFAYWSNTPDDTVWKMIRDETLGLEVWEGRSRACDATPTPTASPPPVAVLVTPTPSPGPSPTPYPTPRPGQPTYTPSPTPQPVVVEVTPTPQPTPTPLCSAAVQNISSELLAAINRIRSLHERGPVSYDPRLYNAAAQHALDMNCTGRVGHQGSDGSSPYDRAVRNGYHPSTLVENLASGLAPGELVDAWMQSPGHRSNILNEYILHCAAAWSGGFSVLLCGAP